MTSSSNPFLNHFPHTANINHPRQIQIDCLTWLWDNFPNSKKFQICAPVGTGKSALAIAVFNYAKSLGMHGLYTSPLNILVDQVDKEFKVMTLKGRRHYPCLSGKENCSKGFCQDDKCAKGLEVRKCEYDSRCKDCGCTKCVYRTVFRAFQHSDIGNTNFTMFLLGIDNSPEVLVIDEADDVEGFTRMHYSLTVEGWINTDFTKAIEELKKKADYLRSIMVDEDKLPDEQRKKYKEELEKIDRILLDYEEHKEPWVISNYTNRKGHKKSKIEPITTERFIEPLLKDKVVIMMSATLSKMDGWEYLETPSPFPVELRQWQYLPLGRMSLKHRINTHPKVASWLKDLKGKTLVHCVSYDTASTLADLLRYHGVYPLLQTNDLDDVDEDTYMRYDIVQAFKTAKDPNKILLSVKLERGTDFPEPDILNNVILAVPFPNPTDPLTKAKNNTIGLSWQDSQIARTIEQSYGRINRNADKKTMTYIVDSNFNNLELGYWYHKNRRYFHEWFMESEVGYNPMLARLNGTKVEAINEKRNQFNTL